MDLLESIMGIGSCGVCEGVPTLPPGITSAPTNFPAECLEIPECSEGDIKYCLVLESGGNFEACLPLSSAPIIVPRFGECGECEGVTLSPTAAVPMFPTNSPSQSVPFPTTSPTGALDGCEIEPPPCELDLGSNSTDEGVVFCYFLQGGGQVELCTQAENVQDLLDQGMETGVFSFDDFRRKPTSYDH